MVFVAIWASLYTLYAPSQASLPGLKSSIVLAVNEDAQKPTRRLLVARYNIFLLWPIGHHWAYPFMDTGTIMVLPWLLGLLSLHVVFFAACLGIVRRTNPAALSVLRLSWA